jgi:hypothetical protein
MDSGVLVFLPSGPADTTVILMLGGEQAVANSVVLRKALGACNGLVACGGGGLLPSKGPSISKYIGQGQHQTYWTVESVVY